MSKVTLDGIDIPITNKFTGLHDQLMKIQEEMDEVFYAVLRETNEEIKNEIVDVVFASLTLLHNVIKDEKERKEVIKRTIKKNKDRGYYDIEDVSEG